MTYTSHGLMTAADLEEYRRDYDWDELRESEPDDEAVTSPDGEVTAAEAHGETTEAQEG